MTSDHNTQTVITCPTWLPADVVHVWKVRLDTMTSVREDLTSLLSREELERARRFRFEKLRVQFFASRYALRILLGRYLATDPRSLRFTYGTHGKPALDAQLFPQLKFNLSHSADLALFAFAWKQELGVDIERIRPLPEMQEIADQHFTREESAELESLPTSRVERAFYHCWTRKEAYLKAKGSGLFDPLNVFRVALGPGEPACTVDAKEVASSETSWTLHNLEVDLRYAAALAYQGPPLGLTILSLPVFETLTAPVA